MEVIGGWFGFDVVGAEFSSAHILGLLRILFTHKKTATSESPTSLQMSRCRVEPADYRRPQSAAQVVVNNPSGIGRNRAFLLLTFLVFPVCLPLS
jgi:hypothetical protein